LSCLFSLIFTEIKHFLDLQDDLISAIIAHYNWKHMSLPFIKKIVAAMINCLLVNSLNFFHLLLKFFFVFKYFECKKVFVWKKILDNFLSKIFIFN
jgi:hypothetical protein